MSFDNFLGVLILIYPDDGYPVVVKLNDAHGPSLLDLIGLVLIVSAYSVFVYSIFRSREGSTYKKIFMLSNGLLIGVWLGLRFENDRILWSAVGYRGFSSDVCNSQTAVQNRGPEGLGYYWHQLEQQN